MTVHLVTTHTFVTEVVHAIQHSKKRVNVLSLIIEQDDDSSPIVTALIRAVNRGVNVSVMADYSTYSFSNGHFSPFSGIGESHELANRLLSHGVSFRWLGETNPFLFAGRSHSKWIVIDDSVYTFGGINLHSSLKSDADYMFAVHDARLAELLVREQAAIQNAEIMGTATISHSHHTAIGEVLIDGGIPFDSIIYREAVRLVRSSSEVLMVTQYCPTGRLAHALKQKKSRVYYNEPKTSDLLTNILITVSKMLTDVPNLFKRSTNIHAKFLIATNADGQKTAITGSHNFISYGGILGTREIALMTTNPAIIQSLENFYQTNIA
jgi:cardiolipin synthase